MHRPDSRRSRPAVLLATLLCLLAAAARTAAQAPTQWQQMDFGPFFSSTFDARPGREPNPAYKGIAIKLRPDGSATALFDTDLLRFAAWWDGGFITLPERSRDGLGDSVAARPSGPVRLGTANVPGWSRDGMFVDPRPQPWGPLPAEQAKYRGLHLHGDRTILSYTIGGGTALDAPGVESHGGLTLFTRTLELSGLSGPVSMLVCDRRDAASSSTTAEGAVVWDHGPSVTAAALAPGGTAARLLPGPDGRTILRLDSPPDTARIKLLLWSGPRTHLTNFLAAVRSSPAPDHLARETAGGPSRWGGPVITRGALGTEPGPYAVDTITAPYDNPWKSYLRFSGHDFFSNGDAAICSVSGDVWVVRGLDASLQRLEWKRYATGLHEPLGLKIVDDRVHVLGRGQITRLEDRNGDGEADFYENFNNDAHYFGHGHGFYTELHTDAEGSFYFTTCADPDSKPGEHGGSLLKVSRDGRRLERVATGFRNPNGMTVGRNGRVTVADQQGTWVPSSRIDWVRPGGFYGYVPMHHRSTAPTNYDAPILWLPHTVDNSCGGQAWIEDDRWGPLQGRLAHLSYGACRLFVVMPEEVDGQIQGAAVALPVKFATGVMRARFHPRDGQLYVSGLRGWQTAGTLSGAFYRVRRTDRPLRMPVDFHVRSHGLAITFSDPLDPTLAADASSYAVSQWNYRWTKEYGSANYSVIDPSKKGEDKVEVKSARLLDDGRTVLLEIPSLRPVMQMRIRYDLGTRDGAPLQGEIHNTINTVPRPASR